MKALGALAGCALAAAACGPSFQAVYECDVHFEHCYAVDMSELPIAEKRLCWREWLAGYTYGESRDRVEHAKSRLAALSSDDPSFSNADGAVSLDPHAQGSVWAPFVQAPLPVNAFSPPPGVSDVRVVDAGEAHPTRDRGRHGGGPLPGETCADTCARIHASCSDGCKGATCAPCDRAYRACMPPCFRDDADAGHSDRNSAH
jgi:hypothetical protein